MSKTLELSHNNHIIKTESEKLKEPTLKSNFPVKNINKSSNENHTKSNLKALISKHQSFIINSSVTRN